MGSCWDPRPGCRPAAAPWCCNTRSGHSIPDSGSASRSRNRSSSRVASPESNATRGWPACWSWWDSTPASPGASRMKCRAGSASASRLPARSSLSHVSWCSTRRSTPWDVSMRTQVLNLIVDLQAEHRFAALFISHDLAATRYVAHRIAVMYAGRFVELGAARRFHERPCHPYSRALGDEEGFRLQGVPEDLSPRGCSLARRCPWNIERCHTEFPELRPVAEGLAACHRAEEIQST